MISRRSISGNFTLNLCFFFCIIDSLSFGGWKEVLERRREEHSAAHWAFQRYVEYFRIIYLTNNMNKLSLDPYEQATVASLLTKACLYI
jgi:hypothetical protein